MVTIGSRGLVSAMTLAALSFSGITGPQPDDAVVVGESAVVVVDGSDRVSVSATSVLRCDRASASPGAVDQRIEAPGDSPAPASTVARLLCVVRALPADIVRPTLPRIAPWLSLMHF